MDEKLKSVLHKVIQLTRQYPEFNVELRKELEIAPSVALASLSEDKMSEIYEYCIEKILDEQAKNFYQAFSSKPFFSQLVFDYKRMERFRRKNDFGDYSLALFQQIECVINTIFAVDGFADAINLMWEDVVYINNKTKEPYKVKNAIFGRDNEQGNFLSDGMNRAKNNKLTTRDRIRIIVYYFKHSGKSNFDSSTYSSFCDVLYNIYLCRNTNHRGVDVEETNATKKVNEIQKSSSYSYFLFNWTLTEFMSMTQDYEVVCRTIINMAPRMFNAIIKYILPSACYIRIEGEVDNIELPCRLQLPPGSKNGDMIKILKRNNEIVEVSIE